MLRLGPSDEAGDKRGNETVEPQGLHSARSGSEFDIAVQSRSSSDPQSVAHVDQQPTTLTFDSTQIDDHRLGSVLSGQNASAGVDGDIDEPQMVDQVLEQVLSGMRDEVSRTVEQDDRLKKMLVMLVARQVTVHIRSTVNDSELPAIIGKACRDALTQFGLVASDAVEAVITQIETRGQIA